MSRRLIVTGKIEPTPERGTATVTLGYNPQPGMAAASVQEDIPGDVVPTVIDATLRWFAEGAGRNYS